jgi:hypothetical protein
MLQAMGEQLPLMLLLTVQLLAVQLLAGTSTFKVAAAALDQMILQLRQVVEETLFLVLEERPVIVTL